MAPTSTKPPPAALARAVANKRHNSEQIIQKIYRKYVNFEFVKYLIFDPAALPIVTVFILLAELLLNVIVINRVPYTEIDWKAYMQECEGFLNGTTNYALLKVGECKVAWKSFRDGIRYNIKKYQKGDNDTMSNWDYEREMDVALVTEMNRCGAEQNDRLISLQGNEDMTKDFDGSICIQKSFSRNEKIIILREVKRHPIIWDISLKEHTNEKAYSNAWTRISEVTGITVEECKLLWNILLQNPNPWKYMKEMSFLMELETSSQQESSLFETEINIKSEDLEYLHDPTPNTSPLREAEQENEIKVECKTEDIQTQQLKFQPLFGHLEYIMQQLPERSVHELGAKFTAMAYEELRKLNS